MTRLQVAPNIGRRISNASSSSSSNMHTSSKRALFNNNWPMLEAPPVLRPNLRAQVSPEARPQVWCCVTRNDASPSYIEQAKTIMKYLLNPYHATRASVANGK